MFGWGPNTHQTRLWKRTTIGLRQIQTIWNSLWPVLLKEPGGRRRIPEVCLVRRVNTNVDIYRQSVNDILLSGHTKDAWNYCHTHTHTQCGSVLKINCEPSTHSVFSPPPPRVVFVLFHPHTEPQQDLAVAPIGPRGLENLHRAHRLLFPRFFIPSLVSLGVSARVSLVVTKKWLNNVCRYVLNAEETDMAARSTWLAAFVQTRSTYFGRRLNFPVNYRRKCVCVSLQWKKYIQYIITLMRGTALWLFIPTNQHTKAMHVLKLYRNVPSL